MNNKLIELASILNEVNNIDIAHLETICKRLCNNGHLVIMNQPYLNLIILGVKTIESRFTKVRCAPYRVVKKGDFLFFKESSGAILAISIVKEVEYFENLTTEKTISLMEKFKIPLSITNEFIEHKKNSRFISLIHLERTLPIHPITIRKKDRRAWIPFEYEEYGTLF